MKLDRSKYLESRSLKPYTLLLAILGVNLLLGILVAVFPSNGISIGKNSLLKFVTFDELFTTPKPEPSANINEILSGVTVNETDKALIADTAALDSLTHKIAEVVKTSVNFDTATQRLVPPKSRSIQLPPSNPNALRMLVNALRNESKTKLIRILHYGDSQLEGDRITDYLRNRMQQTFGGNGPGIVLPLEPAANSRRSVFVSQSSNFVKKAMYVKGQNPPQNHYGIGAATFLATGNHSTFEKWELEATGAINSNSQQKTAVFTMEQNTPTYISIKNGSSAYPLAKTYSQIQLLYQSESPFLVKVQSDNSVLECVINEAPLFGSQLWELETQRKLKIDFVKGGFPKIFGVALDGKTGVAVDNFAMRGSSAKGFDDFHVSLYKKQLEALNVRCIILQYGINVVPNIRSDYTYYRKILSKQLQSIKNAYPGVSVLVIGPSDMSKNQNGNMVSYSNIPLINKAMRDAAFENGCAFWDLYEAMGGKNSMVEWQNNGLARKDYTHFSYKGAKYVGEMLFEALLEHIQ